MYSRFKNKCTAVCKRGDECENHESLVTEFDMSESEEKYFSK